METVVTETDSAEEGGDFGFMHPTVTSSGHDGADMAAPTWCGSGITGAMAGADVSWKFAIEGAHDGAASRRD